MQAWRAKPASEPSIAPYLAGFVKEQSKLAKALGGVAEAFEALIPPDVVAECTLVGLKAGVLTVETRSAGARYALDRILRAGGEALLRERALAGGTKLTRVRLVSSHND